MIKQHQLCQYLDADKQVHSVRTAHRYAFGDMWEVRDANGLTFVVSGSRLQPMSTLPSRFRESQFLRYAPFIGAALREFPNAITIDPAPLSVETFSARLRDAITAKSRFGYKSSLVDEALFTRHSTALVVSMRDSNVVIGDSASVKTQRAMTAVISPTSSAVPSVVIGNRDGLERVCWLLHARALNNPPSFAIDGLSDDEVADLEQRYDVSITPDPNTNGRHLII